MLENPSDLTLSILFCHLVGYSSLVCTHANRHHCEKKNFSCQDRANLYRANVAHVIISHREPIFYNNSGSLRQSKQQRTHDWVVSMEGKWLDDTDIVFIVLTSVLSAAAVVVNLLVIAVIVASEKVPYFHIINGYSYIKASLRENVAIRGPSEFDMVYGGLFTNISLPQVLV